MDIEKANKIIEFEHVDNVPVAFCRPDEYTSNTSIAIWLPYLGGNKETVKTELQTLASYGYFAISIDPYLHGERKGKLKEGINGLVFKEFRTYMWQILGITTMDVCRVIDWAIGMFGLREDVVIGGLSMGGDIAIAVAGIDKRIKIVSVIGASPDWKRNKMTHVMDSTKIIEQGVPSHFGQWLYDILDPITNLQYFHRPLKMHFELGGSDTHIRPEWTVDFKKKLTELYSKAEQNIEIIINEECDHLSLIQCKNIINRAIIFLTKEE